MSIGWRTLIVAAALFGLAACAAFKTDDAESVLRRAEQAMGGTNLKTLRYAGSGSGGTFGQAYRPGTAWPRITYSSYSRVADYENSALREVASRSRAESTGGGAVPLMGMGEQQATGLVRGLDAWNVVGGNAVPAPLTATARIHDLWTTPADAPPSSGSMASVSSLTARAASRSTRSKAAFTRRVS